MFKSANSKVKFQDPQLDDYILENSVLKSKLQSKIDALSIMGKELDKCSMERDKYKLLVEQMKSVRSTPSQENNSVETLKSKLEEATGDIVALRKQLQKKDPEDIYCCRKSSTSLSCSPNDYEQLVQDLEKIHKKYEQLQLDYRATLDEKEELVSDRDYYKNKVQRLNHQISYILANRVKSQQADRDPNAPNPVVDLDAVVMENKYLHERINQLQVEKEIIKRTLTKYKTLLENRTNSNMFHLSKGFADVMTPKQVREYLDVNSKGGSKRTSAGELKSICLGLFEALNDKSTALQHQRKTNHDDDVKEISDSSSEDLRSNYEFDEDVDKKLTSKTVLPLELEELVKEARAEMKASS
ncbi:hypothetical protein MSG28_009688 [Choristoneura fumiferana]|uniref:Uncharacterized protein n=1 Tax=Choristoneura fumiferana TaxID=7141 RepID=A0ACC0JC56_CHOFU|nr:hypothetical protein MSG28_009688 [Choristoneura fumiferana]